MNLVIKNTNSTRSPRNFILHPLIHTPLEFNLAQDMVSCQCGEVITPTVQFCGKRWGFIKMRGQGLTDCGSVEHG